MQNRLLIVPAFLIYSMFTHAQALDFTAVLARVDFSRTLQEWEQGRREPSGAAKALIQIAFRHPEVIREGLQG